MYDNRVAYYKELERIRNSKLLVYVTGDRPNLETQISAAAQDYFVDHLDSIGNVKKISLLLYSRGGSITAAWSIVNLIRQFCEELEVIIPSKAHSAGTLLSLGANTIVMTKQATLGPIDPSVNTALNPQVPGGNPNARVPVSVEAIKGFLELAKDELKINNGEDLTQVLLKLSEMVHPLVLGEVFRARSQIQMLARKLLTKQLDDTDKIDKIISFLCSDSGSHDYTISRREAKDELGLNVEKPDDELYNVIKSAFYDIRNEMELNTTYDPYNLLGSQNEYQYSFKRVLIESVKGGSDAFVSEGKLSQVQMPQMPQMQGVPTQIKDDRIYEGWRHST